MHKALERINKNQSWSLILELNIVNSEWVGSAVHTHMHAQLLRATTCSAANRVRQEDFFVVSSRIRDCQFS